MNKEELIKEIINKHYYNVKESIPYIQVKKGKYYNKLDHDSHICKHYSEVEYFWYEDLLKVLNEETYEFLLDEYNFLNNYNNDY